MTMVRNITSHSERAVAIESGEFSNALSGMASRAAFLVHILIEGAPPQEVPALMANARDFIAQVSSLAERFGSRSTQTYRNLIPISIVAETFEGSVDEVLSLAKDLGHAVSANESERSDINMTDLASRLDAVSDRLAAHAHQVGRTTVGV